MASIGHGLSQEYSGGIWLLSGATAHLPAPSPPYGGLIFESVWSGRSAINTDNATIALAAITETACHLITSICARNHPLASPTGCQSTKEAETL